MSDFRAARPGTSFRIILAAIAVVFGAAACGDSALESANGTPGLRDDQDVTPPVISSGQPTGTLSAGTTQTTMSVTTDEGASCKWNSFDTALSRMVNTFLVTGGALTLHSTPLSGLSDGQSYARYVRCEDAAGNANASSYAVRFGVAAGADTTPPVVSNGQPAGTLPAGTTQATMSVATNEAATCRWEEEFPDAPFADMPNTFTTTGGTAHSTLLTGLADGQSYARYVRCQDGSGNANSTSYGVSFNVASTSDTTPPVISSGQPTGTLPAGTTQATMSVATNEAATCRWDLLSGTPYSMMPNTFTTTGGTAHSTLLTGLVDGQSYARYVRCQDGAGNASTSSYTVSFSVASGADTTPPVVSSGQPAGTLAAGTTQATMSVATDEAATCKWDDVPGTSYAAMPNTFATTGGTLHSTLLTGLVNGQSYTRYVRCQDGAGNANTSSYTVSFNVASSTGPIEISLIANRLAGVAPLTVFFDATGTTSPSVTSRPFHDIEYRWDFGDPAGGATWSAGSRAGESSKNLATGPVAAHVFETPGTYTVTLSAFDGTNTGTASVTITVSDPEVAFGGSDTRCISNTGDFTGCPADATKVTASATDLTTAVAAHQGTNRRLLLRRGEVWNTSSSIGISATGPGMLGAFGAGAKPVIRAASGGFTILQISGSGTPNFADWRFVDLDLDGQDRSVGGISRQGNARQVTYLRMTVRNTVNGVLMYYSESGTIDANFPAKEIAVVDSTISNSVDYGVFLSVQQFALLGSVVETASNQHITRFPYIPKSVISNNRLSSSGPTKLLLKLAGQNFSTGAYNERIVVSDNKFEPTTAWSVSVAPQNYERDERIRDVILERNWFLGHPSSQDNIIVIASEISIRNNIINSSGSSPWRRLIILDTRGVPKPNNIWIYNNTGYASDAPSEFFFVNVQTGSTNIVIRNNYASAPNASSKAMVTGGGDYTASNSLLTDTPGWISNSPVVPLDFSLGAGSTAINSGTGVAIHSDFFRYSRPQDGVLDLGATERP